MLMRLGGHIFAEFNSPEQWVMAVKAEGYSAAYCPVQNDASLDVIRAYERAAVEADIVIAEVGVWNSPLGPNLIERTAALEYCKKQLALADEIGANCCVNISGSRGPQWNGPDPADLSTETFDMIVECVREIIDDVQPLRTFYTLETMQWMYPDSADSYMRLVSAINRNQFGVHFDAANLICSPQIYYRNGDMIRDFIGKLGPRIKSCHIKDIELSAHATVHLDEVRPGLGNLDYSTLLSQANQLRPIPPIMLEHLPSAHEYRLATAHIRHIAHETGVSIHE